LRSSGVSDAENRCVATRSCRGASPVGPVIEAGTALFGAGAIALAAAARCGTVALFAAFEKFFALAFSCGAATLPARFAGVPLFAADWAVLGVSAALADL